MSVLARRMPLAGLTAGVLCALAPALPVHASDPGGVHPHHATHLRASTPATAGNPAVRVGHGDVRTVADTEATRRKTEVLDGFALTYLPAGLGSPSDFTSEWRRVRLHSRVWESRTGDGWRVDATIETLRGDRLGTVSKLRGYLADYLQKDPDHWHPTPVTISGHPGFRTGDRVCWLVRPGVAVSVSLDMDRYGRAELMRTARGIHAA